MYFDTGSSIDNLPCCSSSRIAAAVNCFEIDPTEYRIDGSAGTGGSSFALP